MKDYSYADIMVDTYEYSPFMSLNREVANKFYVDEAKKNGKRVLEFGTATGLLTLPLAREGLYIESIDVSPEMQDHVRKRLEDEPEEVRKNVKLILTDMSKYQNKDEKFDTVIVADNVLLAAGSLNNQLLTLKNAYRNLRDGGKLILDIFTPDIKLLANGQDRQDITFFVPALNKQVFAHTYSKIDLLTQMLAIDIVHEELDENDLIGKRHFSHIDFRYIFPTELILMLNSCKFKITNIYGDFDHNKKTSYDSMQVVIAQKKLSKGDLNV
jgi:SAM-dependent methyltransferase